MELIGTAQETKALGVADMSMPFQAVYLSSHIEVAKEISGSGRVQGEKC